MRIFVTGGTGFVGSHVVEHLLEAGHEPVCLVRETSDTEHLDELGVEQFVGTLAEVEGLAPAVEEVEAVVHIAGVIKVRQPRDFYQINGEATCQLAELVADVNPDLDRFVYLSSIAAQGPCFAPDGREVEPEPVSHYGRSKLLGEQGVRGLGETVPVSIFRPPPVYGPRDEEMFSLFRGASWGIAPVYGDGTSKLSVVHVYDLARGVVDAVEIDHPSGATFPIDDGDYYTWNDLFEICGEAFDKEPWTIGIPPVAFDLAARLSDLWGRLTNRAVIFSTDKLAELEQDEWVCGNDPLREHLDWEVEWPLERGVEQTARWYRDNGWL